MAVHPLHEYFALLEEGRLLELINFYDDRERFIQDKQINDTESSSFYICDVEWKPEENGYLITEISSQEPVEKLLTKELYIEEIFKGAEKRFKLRVRNVYLSLTPDQILSKSNILIKELSNLRKNYLSREDALNYVDGYLAHISKFLNSYSNDESVVVKRDDDGIKLKWLGHINTLATLFYDLNSPSNNLKKKLVDSNVQELTDFILKNFVDANGNTLNRVSIYTFLTHEFKKAKQRFNFELAEGAKVNETMGYDTVIETATDQNGLTDQN